MIKKISGLVAGLAIVLAFVFAGTAQAAEKVTICHKTASDTNTYVWITVSVNAMDVHLDNGDFIPVEGYGCTVNDPVPE